MANEKVYAELPEPHLECGSFAKCSGFQGSGDGYTVDQLRDFADRTHAARLRCKSVQARLAALWGYVRADAAPKEAPAPAWANQPVIEYRYTGGTHWCEMGRAERMKPEFDGVYRLQGGVYPVEHDPKAAPVEPRWWRKRADEIEVQVAHTGSPDAMRCYTDMRTLLQAVTEAEAAQGDALDEVMRERDEAEDFINELLDEVLGSDRPEWSSAYSRYDAMSDVRVLITTLTNPAVDKAWEQFQSAQAAPQQKATEAAQVEWTEQDALGILNQLSDGPFGQGDVDDALEFMRLIDVARRDKAAPQQEAQEPMFYVRLLHDGLYEGPVHRNSNKRDARHEWTPLYTAPQPAPAQVSERDAFEAWVKKDSGDLSTFGTPPNIHYGNNAVNNAWDGWQARAALAVLGGK